MDVEYLGEVGVDSGTLMVCDPCYIVGKNKKERYKGFKGTWNDFLNRTDYCNEPQINYDHGHAGLAVVSPTVHGDGSYSVYKVTEDGKTELRIVLDGEGY